MPFEPYTTPSAAKALRKLPGHVKQHLLKELQVLRANPYAGEPLKEASPIALLAYPLQNTDYPGCLSSARARARDHHLVRCQSRELLPPIGKTVLTIRILICRPSLPQNSPYPPSGSGWFRSCLPILPSY